MPVVTELATLDAILGDHEAALGPDATLYRHHADRVANLCLIQSSGGAERLEKIAVAAAFHDLGIWTDRAFDYFHKRLVQLELSHLRKHPFNPLPVFRF